MKSNYLHVRHIKLSKWAKAFVISFVGPIEKASYLCYGAGARICAANAPQRTHDAKRSRGNAG
jgi:hypothetical protein